MINVFFIVGQIKRINVSEPRDPKKNASAVLLVQYGASRDSTGGAVEFVNAVMIRVPGFKYPALKDKLTVGAQVQVHGHLQGVFKSMLEEGHFTTELVADRIYVDEDKEAGAAEGAAVTE